ncbi:MAG: type III-B CRISPR-associated protein Cas10/Cmr2, partial [Kiritimatiellae bacterium]|nr:type III-B CRISPR-associated protein Cas10/Cmr2 [Kiritimatiellia bacterium]
RRVRGDEKLSSKDCKYYAILCLDGDGMGKWLSGENAQPVIEQLSGAGIKNFFKDNSHDKSMKRAVSPSYHAAFSEALANFSNYCVEPIISKFGGQLIYAGGDDVLAMVPANIAIECAEALQLAFRGMKPQNSDSAVHQIMTELFDYNWSKTNQEEHIDGFLKLKNPGSARPKSIMLLPGPRTTVSVGIAIGHVKSPMQDIIQCARDAEQKAKKSGKDGFAHIIKKRSGETNGFFSHWNHLSESEKWQTEDMKGYSNYYSLWQELFSANSKLSDSSNRLPYIYAQYIAPLLNGKDGRYVGEFDATMTEACQEFLRIVLERQTALKKEEAKIEAARLIELVKLGQTTPGNYINFWMCYAFMNRIEEGGE